MYFEIEPDFCHFFICEINFSENQAIFKTLAIESNSSQEIEKSVRNLMNQTANFHALANTLTQGEVTNLYLVIWVKLFIMSSSVRPLVSFLSLSSGTYSNRKKKI